MGLLFFFTLLIFVLQNTHGQTDAPTVEPTFNPTGDPTMEPTVNPTGDPTIEPTINPTIYPTLDPTINPTQPTQIPSTSAPTTPTSIPTTSMPTTTTSVYYPTIDGCGALHGYVELISPIKQTIISYPVGWTPYSYRLYNISIIGWYSSTPPNPCNIQEINKIEVDQKVVVYNSISPTCHFQQISLNFQRKGALGLLIAVGTILEFKDGDNSLNNPHIPTRLISSIDALSIAQDVDDNGRDVTVTFDCFSDDYPSVICVQDPDYRNSDYRIIGAYQRQIFDNNGTLYGYDNSGHGVWIQNSDYNIGSNTDWYIWFEPNVFKWVIGDPDSTVIPNGIIAYCNDAYESEESLTDPSLCTEWKQINNAIYNITETLIITDDLCPTDSNNDVGYYCIRSNVNEFKSSIGTYRQLMDGISEWYLMDSSTISYLYWSKINNFQIPLFGYGWKLNIGNGNEAVCQLSEYDLSINDSNIIYYPNLCSIWYINTQLDETFDIDSNQCKYDHNTTISDSNATLLCVEYILNTTDGTGYTSWSGLYEIILNLTHNGHNIWHVEGNNNNDYYILYYEIGDGWVIVQNIDIDDNSDLSIYIHPDNILAYCKDNGLNNNPLLCETNCWSLNENENDVNCSDLIITVNDYYDECDASPIIIISTESSENVETTQSARSGAAGLDLEVEEYVIIGLALLIFPILICCFVYYQRRKSRGAGGINKTAEDDGIALQPYVPTGMAYDSFKQNQKHTQAMKKKEKKKKPKTKQIKKPAPTSVGSASKPDPDDGTTNGSDEPLMINPFDEDDGGNASANQTDNEDDHNPLMSDDVIRTGQTLVDDDGPLNQTDIMSAFDE